MVGEWLRHIRTLVQSLRSDVDRLYDEELEKSRKIAEKARDKHKLHELGQEQLMRKKQELMGLEHLLNEIAPKVNALKQEDTELRLRLDAVKSDLSHRSKENEAAQKKVQELTAEVVAVEHDKENRDRNMLNEFDKLKKILKVYKKTLDMRIKWVQPDVYKIWFSRAVADDGPDLILGSLDLRSWEVLDVRGPPELKDKLNDQFQETRNIQKILLEVRKLCVPKS